MNSNFSLNILNNGVINWKCYIWNYINDISEAPQNARGIRQRIIYVFSQIDKSNAGRYTNVMYSYTQINSSEHISSATTFEFMFADNWHKLMFYGYFLCLGTHLFHTIVLGFLHFHNSLSNTKLNYLHLVYDSYMYKGWRIWCGRYTQSYTNPYAHIMKTVTYVENANKGKITLCANGFLLKANSTN